MSFALTAWALAAVATAAVVYWPGPSVEERCRGARMGYDYFAVAALAYVLYNLGLAAALRGTGGSLRAKLAVTVVAQGPELALLGWGLAWHALEIVCF